MRLSFFRTINGIAPLGILDFVEHDAPMLLDASQNVTAPKRMKKEDPAGAGLTS